MMSSISSDGQKAYVELTQPFEVIIRKIEDYVDEYDVTHAKSGLIIFEYAVEH